MISNSNNISFETFKLSLDKNQYLRVGQSLMNTLYKYWKEEHERIIATDLDCFYDDKKYESTLAHLESIWHNRDIEIGNREAFNFDRRRNKVNLNINTEINLIELAELITKSTNVEDLPQLIAIIVKIIDSEELTTQLINHFDYLKNKHYQSSNKINKPFNLLNYEGY